MKLSVVCFFVCVEEVVGCDCVSERAIECVGRGRVSGVCIYILADYISIELFLCCSVVMKGFFVL